MSGRIMQVQTPKVKKVKDSNPKTSSKLLQALKAIIYNQGGTVSYVFVEKRTIFTDEAPLGTEVERKSFTMAPISMQIFHEERKGKFIRRSPQEVVEIFQDTCNDLGATYFIIN